MFIGRERELASLQELYQKDGFDLIHVSQVQEHL